MSGEYRNLIFCEGEWVVLSGGEVVALRPSLEDALQVSLLVA